MAFVRWLYLMKSKVMNPGYGGFRTVGRWVCAATVVVGSLVVQPVGAEELLSDADVARIMASHKGKASEVSEPRKVVLCWSPPDHPAGTHAYELLANDYAERLNSIRAITATAVKDFPTEAQWSDADLVVFNLTVQAAGKPHRYRHQR